MEKISPFRKAWYKFVLNPFSSLIRKDKPSQHYLLDFALKEQAKDFYNEVFIRRYLHIESSIAIIKKFLPVRSPNDVIIDVGGGIGSTAILFANGFPENTVYAFEPLNQNRQEIESNTSSFKNIRVIPKALGPENKQQKLIIGKNPRVSSFLKFSPDYASEYFTDNLETVDEQLTEVTRLDDFLPAEKKILIMKIDVQGFEIEVLKGASRCLQQTSLIVLELNNHDYYAGAPKYYDVDNYLRSVNFHLFDLLPSTRDQLKLKEWDAIYVNNNFEYTGGK